MLELEGCIATATMGDDAVCGVFCRTIGDETVDCET